MKYFYLLCAILLLSALNMACSQKKHFAKISVAEYQDKVYASWLGEIIGNIYGLPHENRHIDEPGPENFPYRCGPNIEYLKQVNGAFSDDDTDIEYMYLLTIEKYGSP